MAAHVSVNLGEALASIIVSGLLDGRNKLSCPDGQGTKGLGFAVGESLLLVLTPRPLFQMFRLVVLSDQNEKISLQAPFPRIKMQLTRLCTRITSWQKKRIDLDGCPSRAMPSRKHNVSCKVLCVNLLIYCNQFLMSYFTPTLSEWCTFQSRCQERSVICALSKWIVEFGCMM